MEYINPPSDWRIEQLGDVCTIIAGQSPPSDTYNMDGNGLPFFQGKTDFGKAYPSCRVYCSEPKIVAEYNDILLSVRAPVGPTNLSPGKVCIGRGLTAIRPSESLLYKFLYYFFKAIEPQMLTSGTGSTFKAITQKDVKNIHIPIPCENTQENIVIKLEELLSKIDKGEAELCIIKEQLEIYRQTILYGAFMGNLSVDLREKKQSRVMLDYAEPAILTNGFITIPELPDGWAWVSIGDISNGVQYGSSQKSNKNGQVPVLRMGNIQNCRFDWSDLVYSSDETEINKYRLKKGDVLFNRTNSPELVGKTAIYKGEQPAIFAGYLIRLNQKDFINPHYLNYYLNSPVAKRCGNLLKTDGVNQSNINGKKLCQYPFPLCTLDEQEYIVDQIESKFSVCDKIEQTVNQSLQKVQTLRQSILKQAFEGKLV